MPLTDTQIVDHIQAYWDEHEQINGGDLVEIVGELLTSRIIGNGQPFALCCCGTPLVGTFEVNHAEWYCITCQRFYGFLHARNGTGPNPTRALKDAHERATQQYAAEREARKDQ